MPAVLEYDIVIDNHIVSLAPDVEPRLVQRANNTKPLDLTESSINRAQNDTMDAITVGVGLLTNANAKAMFSLNTGQPYWIWDSASYNLATFQHQRWGELHGNGTLSYEDPMPSIISTFNEVSSCLLGSFRPYLYLTMH